MHGAGHYGATPQPLPSSLPWEPLPHSALMRLSGCWHRAHGLQTCELHKALENALRPPEKQCSDALTVRVPHPKIYFEELFPPGPVPQTAHSLQLRPPSCRAEGHLGFCGLDTGSSKGLVCLLTASPATQLRGREGPECPPPDWGSPGRRLKGRQLQLKGGRSWKSAKSKQPPPPPHPRSDMVAHACNHSYLGS